MTTDKVLERLAPFRAKGRVVQTSFSRAQEDRLRAMVEAGVQPMPAAHGQMGLDTN